MATARSATPSVPKTGTCRLCHRVIVRGRTYQGKGLVVDADPHADGTVRVFHDGRVYAPTRDELPHYRLCGVALHKVHRHR